MRDAKQAKRSTKAALSIVGRDDSRSNLAKKKFCCRCTPQEIHHLNRFCTSPSRSRFGDAGTARISRDHCAFRHTLDATAYGQITLNSSMHSRRLHVRWPRWCALAWRGARVCRIGHAVPRVSERRHGHRQLWRVCARRRSAGVLDAYRQRRSERDAAIRACTW